MRLLLLRQLRGVSDEKRWRVVLCPDVTKLSDRWCRLHLLRLLEHLCLTDGLLLEDWPISLVRLGCFGRLNDIIAGEDKVAASEAIASRYLRLRHHDLIV